MSRNLILPGLAVAVYTLLLTGCAAFGLPGAVGPVRSPMFALAPAVLGCEVAVQQGLTVELPGRPTQRLEALLEVDAEAVRLAFFVMGQSIGSMVWDGSQWDKQLSIHWPAKLAPEQVLSDLQFAFWPAHAVQGAVKPLWSVEAGPTGRRLLHDGLEHMHVNFIGNSAVEIVYPQGPFILRVESPGGPQLCAQALEPS